MSPKRRAPEPNRSAVTRLLLVLVLALMAPIASASAQQHSDPLEKINQIQHKTYSSFIL